MSITSVSNQIASMKNATTQTKAAEEANNKSDHSTITSNDFLQLMMTQLTNQDPTNPTDTTQYMSQQAQLTQLSATEEMNKSMKSLNTTLNALNSSTALNNQVMQASSLIGKEVSVIDPKDSSKTISGIVTSANFGGSEATIEVNGADYPLGNVYEVSQATGATSTTTSNTN